VIGRIRGILAEKHPPQLLVDVGGVGYEIQASMSTIFELPEKGAEVTLHTQLIVREDAQLLYGFATTAERELFRSLIRINGVGPKLALAILSGMTPNEFAGAVRRNDVSTLVQLPGVGKKTAERLLVEMRDRVKDLELLSVGGAAVLSMPVVADAAQEAEIALVALGYKPQDAARMVRAVLPEGEPPASETLIRAALRALST